GTPQTVTLSLCGSLYDTSVLVYTGGTGSLNYVAANDDGCGTTVQSYLTFNSDGLSTYFITVEGYNLGSTGSFTMEVTCAEVIEPAVANQTCALALAVPVDGTVTESDNSFGDVSVVQPSCDPFGSVQDVWFSFVAPVSGSIDCTVTNLTMTSMNFNVYTGSCDALTAVGTCYSNQTAPVTESLTGLTAGQTYYVQVWSNAAEQGTFTLKVKDSTLGINNFESSDFAYYPNPVKDVLNLSYKTNISSVAIFNLLGQQVVSKAVNANETQIDMSHLPSGTYMVKVTADNQVKTVKVMKQ
ncbi:MAG TPA: T9SS type A sorting domain-containing protein, partial [Flavobacterium sp.]|nr:T9SS type A sorting domain-containing protein [Flavobacterium sp.]